MPVELTSSSQVEERQVSWLPCGVADQSASAASVDANATTYWRPKSSEENKNELVSSFRGRKLNGEKLTLPLSYNGYVINEYKKSFLKSGNRTLFIDGKFNEITYWNWDKETSANDPVKKALEWLEIAEKLHEDVNTDVLG